MPRSHILLVDDSNLVTDALRVLLDANGYRVSVAGSIFAAVERQIRDNADVMLLDLVLPDGDGLGVLTRLQTRNAVIPPTIALTGHDDEITRARCLSSGCRRVMVKPIVAAELLAQVRSLETAPR